MAGTPAPKTDSLTQNVLYLVDEVENYFGGDFEEYDGINVALERIEQAIPVGAKLVLLTQPQLDVVLAALDGFSPHPCVDHADDEHGDESACLGYGPKALAQLALAQDAIATVAREA